jgi:hypothetical protein
MKKWPLRLQPVVFVPLIAGLFALELVIGWQFIASAAPPLQGGDKLPPSIIRFTIDLPSVKLSDVEAGSLRAGITWQTVGMNDNYRLLLYYYSINDWSLVTPDSLPSNGAAQVNVMPSLDFGPPMFRLVIVNRTSQVISQQFIIVPYAPLQPGVTPLIDSFTSDATTVNANLLAQNQAHIVVSWQVRDRAPTSNLVFEQILSDGSAVSVELPRLSRWVASTGQGMVVPVAVGSDSIVRLRLSLVDMVDGRVYSEKEITLLVIGGSQPTATLAPIVVPTAIIPTATRSSTGGG